MKIKGEIHYSTKHLVIGQCLGCGENGVYLGVDVPLSEEASQGRGGRVGLCLKCSAEVLKIALNQLLGMAGGD